MAIEETITVDAGPAIAGLQALADAADATAAKFDAAMSKLKIPSIGGGGGSAGGLGKVAASVDAAAAAIDRSIGKIEAAFARLDGLGAGGGAAIANIGKAASGAAGGLGKFADAQDAVAESSARMAKTSATSADTLKGVGDSVKRNSAWLDEYNATMVESAAIQKRVADVSADASAKIATGQRLNTTAARDASVEAVATQRTQARTARESAAAAEASSHRWKMAGLGALAVVAYGVDQAAKLQAGVTRLQTTAGESAKNLPMISAGILKLAPETATSQAQLLQGAYMAESAGFHGKSALNVLKAGAEGAYAEGAPLGDTINALTSTLNAYGMKGPKAPVSAMDQIIAMVSRGKMTMAGAVAALPTVLPTAASAGLNFGQVGGALATMTATGTSPDLAAQHLNHTIGSLQNMSGVQVNEIQQLGGDPVKLEKNLGKTGLLGTLTDINKLVTGSMGQSGTVIMSTFNRSASAAADANKMLSAMPPSIKGIAKAYADGTVSAQQWNKEIFSGSESAAEKNLLQQYSTVENKAKGYSDLLKSGSPAAQTYQAALSKALGGQTGLQTFLQLEGIHLPAARANTAAVTQAGKKPGADVSGWPEVQKTLKFQLGSAEQGLESMATQFGKAFLPLATTGFKDLANIGKFLASHPTLTKDAGLAGGAVLGVKFGAQLAASIGKAFKIPGLSKLGNVGKSAGLDAAGAALDGAAGSLEGAAGALTGAAERLSTGAGPGGPLTTGGKPGTTVVSEAETTAENVGGGAAAGGLLGKLSKFGGETGDVVKGVLGAANPITAGVLGGLMLRGEGDNLAPKGTPAGDLNKYLQGSGAPGNQAMNHYLGGFDSWLAFTKPGMEAGKILGEMFGQKAPKPPPSIPSGMTPAEAMRFGPGAVPAAPPARYPSGQSYYGEGHFTSPPAVSATPAAAGKLAALSQPGSVKPLKIPAPDTSAIAGAMAKIKAMTSQQANVKPIKLPAPDTSAIAGVKAKITGMMAGISIKPPKIPAPDMGALDSAKGKAASAGSGITSAIQGAMKPAKMPAPDLSAAQGAAGKAAGIGASIGAGLAAGIRSQIGAVQAAGAALAAAASAAMAAAAMVRSPSKVTEKIGKNIAQGLVVGMEGGSDAVKAAATALGQTATKASDVASIDSTIAKLKKQVSGKPAMVMWLEGEQSDLEKLAAKRSRLETEITNSTQAAQSVISGASIMNSLSATVPGSADPIASSAIVQGQGYQATNLAAFAKQLTSLQKAGLNATSLSQIAQSGPDQGLGIAQGINSGGKQAITQLNAIQKKIHTSAIQIGDVTGTAMYLSGQDIGKGLAQGLKDALKVTEKDIEKEAKRVASVIDKVSGPAKAKAKAASKAAGSSSGSGSSSSASGSGSGPASVVGGVKGWDGAASKLTSAGGALTAAASALTSAAGSLKAAVATSTSAAKSAHHPLSPGGGVMHYPVSSGGGGGGQVVQHVTNVYVSGSVRADKDLAKTLQTVYLNQADRNLRTGLQLRNRGS